MGIQKEDSFIHIRKISKKGEENMKKKVTLLLIACLMATALMLASCSGTDLEEFARKYIAAEDKAWLQGDTSDLAKLEDPGIVIHNAGYGDSKGWEDHQQTILVAREMVTEMQQEWEYLAGEGNLFTMSYQSHSVMPGDAPLEIVNDSIFVFQLDNGVVTEMWINGNTTMTPITSEE